MTRQLAYPTHLDAMRASLDAGRVPCLRGRLVRRMRWDVRDIALALGCSVTYDRRRDLYRFDPGN